MDRNVVCSFSVNMASNEGAEKFSYLPPPKDILEEYHRADESVKHKIIRKTKDNPFVPIGVLVTTIILGTGLYQMKTGNKQLSQKMMRYRVGAQGITIFAVLIGVAFGGSAKKT